MQICSRCVMPSTKPDLTFDEEGVCDACKSHEKKPVIDWEKRQVEFHELIKKHKHDSQYDCLVPVSGGKDSTYQVMKILELGLTPLCVCFEPTIPTKIGQDNLQNLCTLGVDLMLVKKNPNVYKKMVIKGIKQVGDNEWPNHIGIFTTPVHFAVKFNIPLIIWGENSEFEYGGPATARDNPYLDRKWLEEFGGLLGQRVSDMIGVDGITEKDLYLYTYPTDEDIHKVGVTGLFLGYYFEWDTHKQLEIVKQKGFQTTTRTMESTYTNFENLDCHSMTIHDYLKYLKYGFGRATDHACLDIRSNRISRKEAVRLVTKYDGRYPYEAVAEFLNYTQMNQQELDTLFDTYTSKKIFQRDENGKFAKDQDGSLVRKEKFLIS